MQPNESHRRNWKGLLIRTGGTGPEEILVSGVPGGRPSRRRQARLSGGAEALRAELGPSPEAGGPRPREAARLSEELAPGRRAGAEAHREVESGPGASPVAGGSGVFCPGAGGCIAGGERHWRRRWQQLAAETVGRGAQAAEPEAERPSDCTCWRVRGRQHLEEAETQRRERQALRRYGGGHGQKTGFRPGAGVWGLLISLAATEYPALSWVWREWGQSPLPLPKCAPGLGLGQMSPAFDGWL